MPEVVYELSLRDKFTKPMHEANSIASTLHETMTSLFEAMGIGFGIYKIVDYFKEATDEVDKIRQAEAQLQAGLTSTQHAAGIGYDELTDQAEKFSHQFKYTKAEVMDMQSIILTFPKVTEKTFANASQAILDMSARLHRGTDETAIMVGKALQDPERGLTALRRVGVNFDKEHSNRIKRMIAQGHMLEAQTAILKELQTEFSGSAAANAAADPLFAYNKSLEETKEDIGNVIVEIQKELAPTLLELAERFRDLVDWLKKNGEGLWNLIKAVGVAVIAFKTGSVILSSYTALMEALVPVEAAAAEGTEAMAAASTLALGPIGLLVIAATALGAAYGLVAQQVSDADDRIKDAAFQRAEGVQNAKADIDTLVAFRKRKFHETQSVAVERTIKYEKDNLQSQIDEQMDIVSGKNTHGFVNEAVEMKANAALKILRAQMEGLNEYSNAPTDISKKKDPLDTLPTKQETKGAKGNRVVTINIHIGSLVKDLQIKTTNLKESAGKIQDAIAQALMGAVNNSQIIAEH